MKPYIHTLTLIFVIAKLTDHIDWSWWWVFMPSVLAVGWWAIVVVVVCIGCAVAAAVMAIGDWLYLKRRHR